MNTEISLRDIALLMRLGVLTCEGSQFVFKPHPGKEELFDLPPNSTIHASKIEALFRVALVNLTAPYFNDVLDF